jgi:hypothetical protein
MSDLSNDTKKHTTKSRETNPLNSGSLDSADFAITRLLINWQVLAIRSMVGAQLAYRGRHSVICQLIRSPVLVKYAKICRLWHTGQSPLAYCAVTAAICQWSHQPLRKLLQSANWKLSHSKIDRIWRTVFNIDVCGSTDCCLKTADF